MIAVKPATILVTIARSSNLSIPAAPPSILDATS